MRTEDRNKQKNHELIELAEQNKIRQNRDEQNATEQKRAMQSRTTRRFMPTA